jgi:S-adenosylmethionine synthetase
MSHYLFTSESVAEGHPDKIADQISDAILDACLKTDPHAKVACETLVTTGLVVLSGEISTSHHHDFSEIARQTIKEIGYDDCALGFSYQSCGVISTIHRQSPEISAAVADDERLHKALGAGDQGMMFGYACNDTPELMPLPIMLSHLIVRELHTMRHKLKLPYLKPDAKAQVTVEYDSRHHPVRIHTVVLSTQHASDVDHALLDRDMRAMIERLAPKGMIDPNTLFYINPAGSFTMGGPQSDCGLTGRKIMVDSYGGMGRHGGGAFSGKDPTKVDRSGAYMARYVAKNIVAAKLADRCEVQVSYAIGVPYPISIRVDTFGTGTVAEDLIEQCIPLIFDLTPKGMIDMLDLRRPIYRQTSFGGHFGRHEKEFTWEKTNKTDLLLEAVRQRAYTVEGKHPT